MCLKIGLGDFGHVGGMDIITLCENQNGIKKVHERAIKALSLL